MGIISTCALSLPPPIPIFKPFHVLSSLPPSSLVHAVHGDVADMDADGEFEGDGPGDIGNPIGEAGSS